MEIDAKRGSDPSLERSRSPLNVEARGLTPAPAPIRTTCPYCGVGCGVLATPDGKGGAAIRGDPEHPANAGRLCSKGSALGETLGLETRLLHPIVDGARTSWAHALDQVARRLAAVRAAHGPEAIAFYLSGQLLTEDYYVANKLAKGFIGTPHVDTNSRLCMASSVAGHRRAFGADVVPQCYDDLELADLVVLAGSNAAWCHPILYQRIQTARGERGMRVVNIDPRRTATSEGVDLQLSLKPGSDGVLWSGLLVWLAEHRIIDTEFINAHTQGFFAALWGARAIAPTIGAVAAATGLDERDVERFYDWFASTSRVVSCYSQGVNQSAQGTDKVNAILNCHLATGRIGKPGSGPLSLTGQPNAMGGREVGGLANMLAAHMGFSADERDRVRRFWNAPNLVAGEGLKAVDMFQAVADGRIKALWIMGTNPAVSLPRADAMRAALSRLELLVVSDNVASNDTVRPRAHRAAGGGVGREGRHRHQLGALRLAPACLPAAARTRPARLVDAEPGGAAPGARQRLRLSLRRRHLRRARAPVGLRERRQPCLRHLGARRPRPRGIRRARTVPMAIARRRSTHRAPVRRWPVLHQRRQGPLRGHRRAAPFGVRLEGVAVRPQHRPRARPVAHHDAHGALAAPLQPHRRAVRGDSPRRRRGAWGWCRGRWRA